MSSKKLSKHLAEQSTFNYKPTMQFTGVIKDKSDVILVGEKQTAKCEFTLERETGRYSASIRITAL